MTQLKNKVLARDAWNKLPDLLQQVVREFSIQKIYYPETPYELPPGSPRGIHFHPDDRTDNEKDYLSYVRKKLKAGCKDPGQLKSFMQGLRVCGPEGLELIKFIKEKVLRR